MFVHPKFCNTLEFFIKTQIIVPSKLREHRIVIASLVNSSTVTAASYMIMIKLEQ